MAVAASDLRTLYTAAAGPGRLFPQPDPAASVGPFASQTPWTGSRLADLFGPAVPGAAADYRCLYMHNAHPTDTATTIKLAVLDDATGLLSVGVDPAAASPVASASPQTLAGSAQAAPVGVTFSAPTDPAAGVLIGDLPAGYGRGVWVRRLNPPLGTAAAAAAVTLAFQFS